MHSSQFTLETTCLPLSPKAAENCLLVLKINIIFLISEEKWMCWQIIGNCFLAIYFYDIMSVLQCCWYAATLLLCTWLLRKFGYNAGMSWIPISWNWLLRPSHRYASQHIWCLSQARINWEGCARKGIRRKNGGDSRGGRHQLVWIWWQSIRIVGASACVIFILHQKIQKMAKCTFCYQLTWVVRDKVQRAVKWLCVCVTFETSCPSTWLTMIMF